MGAYSPLAISLRTPSGPVPVGAIEVSKDFLRTLGTVPMLGRDFVADDAKAVDHETILSYASSKARFGGRSDIIGQTVEVGGNAATVVGVLPANFQFAPGEEADFWFPPGPGERRVPAKARLPQSARNCPVERSRYHSIRGSGNEDDCGPA